MFLRSRTPFARGLALFLCTQPVLWMSNVALAQTIDSRGNDRRDPRDSYFPDARTGDSRSSSPPDMRTGESRSSSSFDSQETEPQQGSERPAPVAAIPPVDEPLDPERYVLGPGDVLELHFWGIENFRLRVPIDLEGRAFVAKIGYLALGGKTLADAQRIMGKSVAKYFPKLDFGITLAQPRTFLVQVVDDVVRPGPYPARALDRVSAVITRAGGLGPSGSMRRIEIQHRDGTVSRADLLRYQLTGDVRYNPYVLDGDVVRVPFQELVATIGGAVNRPGKFELVGSSDLAELVELAGGLAPNATRALPVTVVRRVAEEKLKRFAFDFGAEGQLPSLPLASLDSVWVPSYSDLSLSVTITGALAGVAAGAVAAAGTTRTSVSADATANARGTLASDEAQATRRLPFAEGDTAGSVLERVGGPGPLADLKGAYIIRNEKAIPVDLYALIILRDLKADRPLELGDTLVLPFRRQGVVVEGAVFKPGQYPYNPTFGPNQYLALAGGTNRFAQSIDDAYLITPSGETKPYAPDLKVEPGASLVVPERDFSRSEVVGLIIAGAGLLLSATAIFVTLRK